MKKMILDLLLLSVFPIDSKKMYEDYSSGCFSKYMRTIPRVFSYRRHIINDVSNGHISSRFSGKFYMYIQQ